MDARTLTANTVATVAGGIVGSRLMNPVTTKLYELESEEDKQREKAASKGGSAPQVAAEKTARLLGHELDEDQAAKGAQVMHYLTGIAAVPLYLWLRQRRHMGPLTAGLASGLALFMVMDEVANPLMGTSGPPQAYPASTHVRGVVGHAVFGIGVAATAESALALFGRSPATASDKGSRKRSKRR